MPTQFQVERSTVVAAAKQLVQTQSDIGMLFVRLDGELSALLHDPAVWRGDAQVSFASAHHQVDSAAKKINTALEDIAKRLKAAQDAYAQADSDGSAGFTTTATSTS